MPDETDRNDGAMGGTPPESRNGSETTPGAIPGGDAPREGGPAVTVQEGDPRTDGAVRVGEPTGNTGGGATRNTTTGMDEKGTDLIDQDPGATVISATVEEEQEPPEPGIFDELYTTLFGKSWNMWIGCIILSILSISLFIIASPWGSSGGLNNFGQNFYSALGMDFPESASTVPRVRDFRIAMLSLNMLLGAMGSALMAKEFAIRIPPKGELVKGLIGGVLMGIGAILGMGCTIGGFYSGWPSLSGGALVFTLGMFFGVYIAIQYLLWEMENRPGWSSGKTSTYLAASTTRMSYQPIAGLIVLAIGASLAIMYNGTTEKVLIGFVLIGLAIGFVLQRSRFCVVRALREPFISGDADPAVAIMAGLLVGILGFTVIKVMGIRSETVGVAPIYWVPAILGGVIFGMGMTVAGGCTTGATWRAAEGHVKLWMALVGIILTMPLAGEYLRPGLLDMLPDSMNQSVFLPDTLGYGGAVSLMLLIITIWFIFVRWNERTGKLAAF